MQPIVEKEQSEKQFVVDLLTTLQKERFSPLGWWRFIVRSWNMSCKTANNNPALKRSWLVTSLVIAAVTVALLITNAFLEGPIIALRLLPGLVFCVAWQQSDLFWHLGLNRSPHTGLLAQTVGLANTLTEVRGVGAAYLLARLVAGVYTPSWLALLVFLLGVVTDILDGQVARRTHTQSKLGQITDGEADFCLYLALTIILIQNSLLPLWIGLIMLLRFVIPLFAAFASYFLLAQPVRFGSTVWGKYAGLAQSLYFLVLLAPPQLALLTQFVSFPLLLITIVLLIVAPIVQIVQNVQQ